MKPTRVLICGGRDYNNKEYFTKTLHRICEERGWNHEPDQYGNTLPNIHIIHGGAKGADSLADDFAVVNWTGLTVFPAEWDKYGQAAGAIRNKQMLVEGKPDIVIAFPGGRGTAHMCQIAKRAGIKVIKVKDEMGL